MAKKPLAIDASTVLATRNREVTRPPGLVPRYSETLVDLNFKVPADFRRRFKQLALDADLKNVQLLRHAVDAYERELRAPDG